MRDKNQREANRRVNGGGGGEIVLSFYFLFFILMFCFLAVWCPCFNPFFGFLLVGLSRAGGVIKETGAIAMCYDISVRTT